MAWLVLQLTVSGGSKRRVSARLPVAHEIVKEYYMPHALQSRHLRIFFLQRIYGVFLHNAEEKESIQHLAKYNRRRSENKKKKIHEENE